MVDPAAPSTRLDQTVPPSRGLSLAGPLRRAVGEFLPFPYGQAELDLLDDGLEDAQRLFPVGGRNRCAQRDLAHAQTACAVEHRDLARPASCGDVGGDLSNDVSGFGVRLVIDGHHRPGVVVIAHLPAECDDCARAWIVHGGGEGLHVDGLGGDAGDDRLGVGAVAAASILNGYRGGLVRRGMVAVSQLVDDVPQKGADGGDGVAHAARRSGRVEDENPVPVLLDDASHPAGEGGGGNSGIVPQKVFDADEPAREQRLGRLRREIAAGDSRAAHGEDGVRPRVNRLADRRLHRFDAVAHHGGSLDLAEVGEKPDGERAGNVLALPGKRAVGDCYDGDPHVPRV